MNDEEDDLTTLGDLFAIDAYCQARYLARPPRLLWYLNPLQSDNIWQLNNNSQFESIGGYRSIRKKKADDAKLARQMEQLALAPPPVETAPKVVRLGDGNMYTMKPYRHTLSTLLPKEDVEEERKALWKQVVNTLSTDLGGSFALSPRVVCVIDNLLHTWSKDTLSAFRQDTEVSFSVDKGTIVMTGWNFFLELCNFNATPESEWDNFWTEDEEKEYYSLQKEREKKEKEKEEKRVKSLKKGPGSLISKEFYETRFYFRYKQKLCYV